MSATDQLTPEQVERFRSYIYRFFDQAGRHQLPWRQNYDPYHILVSEIMLQQTQVERVIPKFEAFLAAFPNPEALATASVADVIRQWQGLGYNRRGLNLQKAAQKIMAEFGGHVPEKLEDLLSLPGIGPYTAAAIQAFAFNQPSIVIETNIRTVFIFHFFHDRYQVDDTDILALIELTLDREQPRTWYSALMDFGSYLKQIAPNPTRRSKTYTKQSPFATSNRKIRGEILRVMTENHRVTHSQLETKLGLPSSQFKLALDQLLSEGFLLADSPTESYRLNDQ